MRVLLMILLVACSGCASHPKESTERYPVTEMIDPVTEGVPHVILP